MILIVKKKYIIYLLIVILIFSFAYFQSKVGNSNSLSKTRNVFFNILSSINGFFYGISNSFTNTVANFSALKNADQHNQELMIEIERLKIRQINFEKIKQENNFLRQDLKFRNKKLTEQKAIATEVIARSIDSWFESVIINKGWKDGIETDYPVINTEGLVGRVVETSEHKSKIMLILNTNSNVSAEAINTEDTGIIEGRGIKHLLLKYVPYYVSIAVGDPIYTSGVSDIFPKGVLIGNVSKVLQAKNDYLKYIEVEPAVNFAKLRRLWVIVLPKDRNIKPFNPKKDDKI